MSFLRVLSKRFKKIWRKMPAPVCCTVSIRYVIINCIKPYCIVALAVLLVVWMIQSIRIIELILSHDASVRDFFWLSLYTVPYILFVTFPISLVCTLLYVIKKMYNYNELMMLQCLGKSKKQIGFSFVYFSLMLCAVHYFISFYVMPLSYRNFRVLEEEVKTQYTTIFIEDGSFTEKFDGLTLYVGKRIGKNKFSHIFIHDARNTEKTIIVTAESGEIGVTGDGSAIQLKMHNGTYQEEHTLTKRNAMLFFKNYNMVIDLSVVRDYKPRFLDANERYINEMLGNNSIKNILDSQKYRKIVAYGHHRIVWPLTNIAVTLAIVVITLQSNKERHEGYVFLWAFFSGITILLLSIMLQNMALKNTFFIFGMYIEVLMPIFILLSRL